MPDRDGIAVTRIIKHAHPTVRVLLLTIVEDAEMCSRAREARAAGYLFKDMSHQELVTAIHQVLQGKVLFD